VKDDPLRGVYRALVVIGLVAFAVFVMGSQAGRSLALKDNARDAAMRVDRLATGQGERGGDRLAE